MFVKSKLWCLYTSFSLTQSSSPCQWLHFKLSHLLVEQNHSHFPSEFTSQSPSIIALPPPIHSPPPHLSSPRRPANQASSRAGPHDLSRELAKSTGPGPEQRSWAARAQISPPQSGAGAPLLPGLQLEERRLEREGGADWDTRDSKSRF